MNKRISVIRIAILFVLFTAAMLFLFGQEPEDSFFFRIIVDKALAFGLFYYVGKLYKRWSKVDPWLKAYDKMCDEVMDKPNPSQL